MYIYIYGHMLQDSNMIVYLHLHLYIYIYIYIYLYIFVIVQTTKTPFVHVLHDLLFDMPALLANRTATCVEKIGT